MVNEDRTDFGFETVPVAEKADRVRAVFDSVVERYDLMNDLMSFGLHRLWKRFAVAVGGARAGQRVLDVASGSGDLARLLARQVGARGLVVLTDVNAGMLDRGRRRMLDAGLVGNVAFVQADAERLPFPGDHFDAVHMGFGLRNVTHKELALEELFRVLRPGAAATVLEFSRPTVPALRRAYDAYSFRVLPGLGERVAGDAAAYRYLAESIRMHPDQETLLAMMGEAGFERCRYFNLAAGVVAVHRGFKL